MKICPACKQKYADDTLNFCLNDGVGLANASANDERTILMDHPLPTGATNQPTAVQPSQSQSSLGFGRIETQKSTRKSRTWIWAVLILSAVIFLCGGGVVGLVWFMPNVRQSVVDLPGNSEPDATPTVRKTASPSALKMENYDKVKTGMTYDEVVELLGVDGDQISESGTGSYKTAVYMWRSDNFTTISLIFMNDKLFSKTKTGF